VAKFKALSERIHGAELVLPVGGVEYTIPEPSADTGLRLQALMSTGIAAASQQEPGARDIELLSDSQELDLFRDALGSAYDDMKDSGIGYATLKHAAMTAFFYWTISEEAAAAYWESGGKAPAPNRATRRAASKPSPSTAAARTTRKRASTSGTTSRRT
jgi:hypothetical protein